MNFKKYLLVTMSSSRTITLPYLFITSLIPLIIESANPKFRVCSIILIDLKPDTVFIYSRTSITFDEDSFKLVLNPSL